MRIELDVRLHFDSPAVLAAISRVETGLAALKETMMADTAALGAKIDELSAKVDETATTLAGLVQEIADLKNQAGGVTQEQLDALQAKVQDTLDRLTVAEDAADDSLPAPPPAP